jgi:hypothetical protein
MVRLAGRRIIDAELALPFGLQQIRPIAHRARCDLVAVDIDADREIGDPVIKHIKRIHRHMRRKATIPMLVGGDVGPHQERQDRLEPMRRLEHQPHVVHGLQQHVPIELPVLLLGEDFRYHGIGPPRARLDVDAVGLLELTQDGVDARIGEMRDDDLSLLLGRRDQLLPIGVGHRRGEGRRGSRDQCGSREPLACFAEHGAV